VLRPLWTSTADLLSPALSSLGGRRGRPCDGSGHAVKVRGASFLLPVLELANASSDNVKMVEAIARRVPGSTRWGRPSRCGIFLLGALLSLNAPAANWLTDLPSAQATAKAENKIVLIDFTGSDWCGWCIRLRNEVFSRPEFEAYANQNLILVEADFPRRKEQSAELKQANAALQRRFHIEGYPTIIVLNSDGQQIGTMGYQPGGPQAFIAELARLSGRLPLASASETKQRDDSPPPPPFNGAPLLPPPQFNDLVLKGLAGPKNNRLALLNNKTLGVGESALLKLGDHEVRVKCVEIRQDSIMVSVDGGEPKEVRLRTGS